MLHQEKAVIAQRRILDETIEVTQVRQLDAVDLRNAVVTADAAHACRETAEYIAGKGEDGGRGSHYFLFVKGNQSSLQRVAFGAGGHGEGVPMMRPRPATASSAALSIRWMTLESITLKLTYQPSRQVVEAEIRNPDCWQIDGVRGAIVAPTLRYFRRVSSSGGSPPD